MNPSKRVANRAVMRSKDKEQSGAEDGGSSKFKQLPQDLVMEILSRLSMKTLFNCRCVCKEWLSVISDPQFSHLHNPVSPVGILIKNYYRSTESNKLEFAHVEKLCAYSDFVIEKMNLINRLPISEFHLINSCNGLICLSGTERYDPLYVCNPILGEFITIPPTLEGRRWGSFVGLGFSVGTKEYKVLQTSLCDNYAQVEAEIYTIGKGVWRSIGNAPMDFPELPFNAYLRGALHWVSYWNNMSMLINTFNFEAEQFRRLPSPSYFGRRKMQSFEFFKLGVLQGCLLLSLSEAKSNTIDMWVMNDYGVQESWTKILVMELYPAKGLCTNVYEPILFLSNGEILMVWNNLDVVCYNKKIKSLRDIRLNESQLSFDAIAYSPSFISLYDVSIGEEVKRVRSWNKTGKLQAGGSSESAGSGISAHKFTKGR